MHPSLRLILLLGLASAAACGSTSTTPNTNTDAGPGGSDTGPGSCSCTATIQDDTRELACGEASCVGPSGDDRWVTCTKSGMQIGTNLCIQDQWAATSSAGFDCDGRQTCPPDTYCVLRAGPVPRRTECRPIPSGCTPPTSDDQFCNCLKPDALKAGVCAGSDGIVSCNITDPRKTSMTCAL